MAKITQQQFIDKSMNIHGSIYTYNKTIYVNAHHPITVTCNIHGDFTVVPNKHISAKQGCPVCSDIAKKERKSKKSLGSFFTEATEVHGDKYDYSKVFFNIRSEKITIICKEKGHGEFNQVVSNHLSGQGCPECAKIQNGLKKRTPEDVFFEDCKFIHMDNYDYSNTKYNGMYETITPLCKRHGEFTVLATKHYHRKQGCSVCSDQELKSKPVIEIQNFLKTCDIMFEMEKKFDSCKNINHLPFDFYIPELNLLIEYDGIQHFKPIEYFGGEEGLAEQQRNDEIKNKYCYDNNITLLRIKYSDDHIKIIKDFISKNINY